MREENEEIMTVDEARGVGLGLGKEKEKWEPVEAFSVDTLTRSGSGFLVVVEDLDFAEGSDFWGRCVRECAAGCARP